MTTIVARVLDGKTGHDFDVVIRKTPPRIECGGVIYRRVDDPDTGEFLGCYLRGQGDA